MKTDKAPVDVEFATFPTAVKLNWRRDRSDEIADCIPSTLQSAIHRPKFVADRPTPDDWPIDDD